MAIKMYKKKNCKYKNGYITHKGKVVSVDNKVVDLFNKLEEDMQRAMFERQNEQHCYCAPVQELRRKTERGNIVPTFNVDTPELDEAIDKSMLIMNELDTVSKAKEMEAYLRKMIPLIEFMEDKEIVSTDQAVQHRFDLPTIGNPLNMNKETLSSCVSIVFGMDFETVE